MIESRDMRWLRWLLSGIMFFLAVIALELSVLVGPVESRAMAVLPDSAQQRNQLIDGQRRMNENLASILQHLRSQVIKVKVVSTDKDKGSTSGRSPDPDPDPDKE